MSSFRGALIASLGVLAIATPTALAHGGQSINYISRITSVAPQAGGVTVDVLDRDDRLQVTNRGRSTVVVEGYDKEPYLRLRPGGTVEVNRNSPAYYLNEDRYADVKVPKSATRRARPDWRVLDHAGRVDWHDHRIHWMAKTRPGMVKDPDTRTKVFDWTVPIRVDGRPGKVAGDLYWVPRPGGKVPAGAIIGLAGLVLAGGALVVVVRRRRSGGGVSGTGEAW